MKKYKYLLFSLFIPLLVPTQIYAECTKEEINNFERLKDEYKVTYEFNKETKLYSITFYNPNPKEYGYTIGYQEDENTYNNTDLTTIEETQFTKENVSYGKYDIEVITTKGTCQGKLKRVTLNLSKYNPYSEDPLCEDIEEFVLCQPTYDKDIDYDTFASRVDSYKKELAEKKENNNKEAVEKKGDKVLEYIRNNIFQVAIITAFAVIVIITVILTVKSQRESRRLE